MLNKFGPQKGVGNLRKQKVMNQRNSHSVVANSDQASTCSNMITVSQTSVVLAQMILAGNQRQSSPSFELLKTRVKQNRFYILGVSMLKIMRIHFSRCPQLGSQCLLPHPVR